MKLRKREKKTIPLRYSDGGEGFIKWCNDFVRIKIYIDGLAAWCPLGKLPTTINPETGRCSKDMWDFQCDVARKCLKMKNGRFVYRLIVLCWMRGEGKSLFVCLVQLWKFFNFPAQQIMLGANSKDQVKFVHFDIMRDIILNSPALLAIVGRKNVQEKEIRLKNSKGEVVSIVRSISSFSGIVSNITGYTFSEIFDMKNPKFFTQLDGSIRNIPNALGVIDSTVSTKDHILYKLYDTYRKGLDQYLYFSHRQSINGSHKDFTNPEMTQAQLTSYRNKFPDREFAMYFKNTWDAGAKKMFTAEMVEAIHYLGWSTSLGEIGKIVEVLKRRNKYLVERESNGQLPMDHHVEMTAVNELIPVEKVYSLTSEHKQPVKISMEGLKRLSDLYDTNFALLCGVDRADPMKRDLNAGAKTIVSLIAKGLPGSRSNPLNSLEMESSVKQYLYFQVDLQHIIFNDMDTIKQTIENYVLEYDGIQTLCTERWGMWDIGDWCADHNIVFIPITATYTLQKEGFSEFYQLVSSGRYKCPEVAIQGVKSDDLLVEEMSIFDHDHIRQFYGSPEKKDRFGIQDDTMFAINWSIYGGRLLTVDDFVIRSGNVYFGEFFPDKGRIGA